MTLSALDLTIANRVADVRLTLAPGAITAICGPNGAGKSTLLETLAGLTAPDIRDLVEIIRKIKASGVTIILTTHYIEEAEEMADRIGVIDRGRLVLVEEKRANSANILGSAITEGVNHSVVKGDMLMVPANTPHQVIPTGGAPIVLMTMHVPFPPANWPPAN